VPRDKHSYMTRSPKVDHLKPKKYKDYLTIGEVAQKLRRDVSRLKDMERQDRIPKAVRHKVGKLEIRLYSPAAVEEIEVIFAGLRPGRPKANLTD
jgi:hypothetical protein